MSKSQQYLSNSTMSPPTSHHQNNKDITSISLPIFSNPSLKRNRPSPTLGSNATSYDTTNQLNVAPESSGHYRHRHLPPPPLSSSSFSSQQPSTEQNNYDYYRGYYDYYHNQDQQYHRSRLVEQNGAHAPYSYENGNEASTSYSYHTHDNYHYNKDDYHYTYYPPRVAPLVPDYELPYSEQYRVQRKSFSMPVHIKPNGGHRENEKTAGKYKHKICRPPNAWILYRSAKILEIKNNGTHIGCTQANLSKQIAEDWRQEPPEVKQRFDNEAERRKKQHEIKYPGYKFQPNKPGNPRKRRKNRPIQSYSVQQADSYPSPPSPPVSNGTAAYGNLPIPQETNSVAHDPSRHRRASTSPPYAEAKNITDNSKHYGDTDEMYYYDDFPGYPSRKTSINSEYSSIWKRPSFSFTPLSHQDSVEGSSLGTNTVDRPGSSVPSAEPSKARKITHTTTDPASFASTLAPINAQVNKAEHHEAISNVKYRSFPQYSHHGLHDSSYQQKQYHPQRPQYQSSEGSKAGNAHPSYEYQEQPSLNALPSLVLQSERENGFSSTEQPNYTLQSSTDEPPVENPSKYNHKESAGNAQVAKDNFAAKPKELKEQMKSYSFP